MVSPANVEQTIYLTSHVLDFLLPASDEEVDKRLVELRTQHEVLDKQMSNLAMTIADEPARALSVALRELENIHDALWAEYQALWDTSSSASREAASRRVQELCSLVQQELVTGEDGRRMVNALLRQIFSKIVPTQTSLALHWKHAPGRFTTLDMISKANSRLKLRDTDRAPQALRGRTA
jgi:hypothetical protein